MPKPENKIMSDSQRCAYGSPKIRTQLRRNIRQNMYQPQRIQPVPDETQKGQTQQIRDEVISTILMKSVVMFLFWMAKERHLCNNFSLKTFCYVLNCFREHLILIRKKWKN
jgi:hypothetical protein